MGNYKPLTEEEALSSGLMEPSIYDFEVTDCTFKQSQSGNDMYELKLNIFDINGVARPNRAWALPEMPKQWKHLHDACGMIEQYQSGIMNDSTAKNFIGKAGKLKLIIGKYTNKDGLEIQTNRVDDYVKRDNLTAYKDALEVEEIPFG